MLQYAIKHTNGCKTVTFSFEKLNTRNRLSDPRNLREPSAGQHKAEDAAPRT